MSDASQIVEGVAPVIAHFGSWPTFHDAEMYTVLIDRDGPTITIRFLLNELREDGGCSRANITLQWHEVEELSLLGIDKENWLYQLGIKRGGVLVDTEIIPNKGTGGTLRAKRVEVIDFQPLQ